MVANNCLSLSASSSNISSIFQSLLGSGDIISEKGIIPGLLLCLSQILSHSHSLQSAPMDTFNGPGPQSSLSLFFLTSLESLLGQSFHWWLFYNHNTVDCLAPLASYLKPRILRLCNRLSPDQLVHFFILPGCRISTKSSWNVLI